MAASRRSITHYHPDPIVDEGLRVVRRTQRRTRNYMAYLLRGEIDEWYRKKDANSPSLENEARRYEHPVLKRHSPILNELKAHNTRVDYTDGSSDFMGPEKLQRRYRARELRLSHKYTAFGPVGNANALGVENAVNEMARRLHSESGKTPDTSHLRFVKLLGAGGQGFVALFDARRERAPGQGPWDVNFYVCKGIIRDKVISPLRVDPATVAAFDEYHRKVRSLVAERTTQLDLAGNLHILQAYGGTYDKQTGRLMLHIVTNNTAKMVDANDRHQLWQNRHTPAWTGWPRLGAVLRLYQPRLRTRITRAHPTPAQPPPPPPVPVIQIPQVQQTYPAPPPGGQQPGVPYIHSHLVPHGYNQFHAEPGMLFLEYLPRGDLSSFIARQNTRGPNQSHEPPPNRVLWLIWECFLKMVVALDQPVKGRRQLQDQDECGPLESEAYYAAGQAGSALPRKNYVHFDIDPHNIFVGPSSYTGIRKAFLPSPGQNTNAVVIPNQGPEDGHGHAPLMKLADFGLTESRNPQINRNMQLRGINNGYYAERQTHSLRLTGKDNFKTPEQFTHEWDYVNLWPVHEADYIAPAQLQNPQPPLPQTLPGRPPAQPPNVATRLLAETPVKIAGLYGWKTNLYQLALTMFSIITGHYPPSAPIAQEIIKVTTTPNAQTTNGAVLTFGGLLLHDNNPLNVQVDRELRETIALCLAQDPDDRPEHDVLTEQVKRRLAYYTAVHDSHHARAGGGPAFNTWAASHPANNAPPSERVQPDMDRVEAWSALAFPNPPPTRLKSRVDYDAWVNGIQQKDQDVVDQNNSIIWHQGDYEYGYAVGLEDLPDV